MARARSGDLGLDLVQFRHELLDLLRDSFGLVPGSLRIRLASIAEVEKSLGRDHETRFDLRIDVGDRARGGDRGREDAGQGVVIAR